MKKTIALYLILFYVKGWAQPCTPNTNSIDFNGTSDYVSLPSSSLLDLTSQVTLEAWIYPTQFATNSASGSIICKHGWYSGEAGFVLRAGGAGQLSFNIAGDSLGNNVSWKEVVSPANAISLNTWSHVAGTFDGDSLNIYVNGQLVNTLLFTGNIINSSAYDMKIGRLADMNVFQTRYWTGLIDEARVWNRALTSSEIFSNMNTQIDPALQTGLVGYWRLNDGAGTTVSDLSSNSLTGTLNGSGWSTNVPFATGAPPATITASGNTTFCDGGSVTLNANTGSGLNYLWSNGTTSSSIVVSISGTFTVTVTDANNCSATSAPLVVTANPTPAIPVITFNGTQLTSSVSTGLQWYLNGSTLFNQVGQTYNPTVNGSYTVIVTSINGCTSISAPFVVNTLGIGEPEGLSGLLTMYNSQNQVGHISFELTAGISLILELRDFQGRTVKSIVNENLQLGKYTYTFNGSELPNGVYLIYLKSNTGSYMRKITITN